MVASVTVGELLAGILLVGCLAVLISTYLIWASRRAWGNAPYPPLSRIWRQKND